MLTLLIVVIAIALLFDLVNGFHDAANSIATVVSTKVLTPFQAVVWAALFNVLAFWVFDMSVGNTVAKTVDSSAIDLWVILAGLLAATVWNLLTWWFGIPSSSSHTLIGGFAGAAVAHAGFGVIASKEIILVVIFIFFAPLIGGLISFFITLITISRNFFAKISVWILTTLLIYWAMNYMIEYQDMKPIMMHIVVSMLCVFIFTYTIFEIRNHKKPSANRESNMHKKLQLLSSAAFSLGHGGADSQKVMGIICAALMVYDNYCRENNMIQQVPDALKIAEVMQIEYKDQEGKLHKFKPEYSSFNGELYSSVNNKMVSLTTGDTLMEKSDFNGDFTHLNIYTKGKEIVDNQTDEVIFKGKKLNIEYPKSAIFLPYVDENTMELKSGYKLKTKVKSETMPIWISFGCYLMIGLGTLMGGWKIVKTMGTKITKVTPLEGVCAETAGALTLFTVSQFGIPVSTTHTITGSIIGVGATKRLSAVRWGVTINLLWAWVLTIPVSATLAAFFLWAIKLFV
ncbi:MAG: inorganic phosphate transporter [Flavobacteriales bacterium]|nr:inorganic phosphate transporter [Flavobacteriales bacterium]